MALGELLENIPATVSIADAMMPLPLDRLLAFDEAGFFARPVFAVDFAGFEAAFEDVVDLDFEAPLEDPALAEPDLLAVLFFAVLALAFAVPVLFFVAPALFLPAEVPLDEGLFADDFDFEPGRGADVLERVGLAEPDFELAVFFVVAMLVPPTIIRLKTYVATDANYVPRKHGLFGNFDNKIRAEFMRLRLPISVRLTIPRMAFPMPTNQNAASDQAGFCGKLG